MHIYIKIFLIFKGFIDFLIGDWGLGIGGLGIGDW